MAHNYSPVSRYDIELRGISVEAMQFLFDRMVKNVESELAALVAARHILKGEFEELDQDSIKIGAEYLSKEGFIGKKEFVPLKEITCET